MWELQFDFYSFMAQYLTLRGIREDDNRILNEADRCYATACEIGLPLYGVEKIAIFWARARLR